MSALEASLRFLTERDRQVMEVSGYGARMGFGLKPALLIVDATYAFCGEEPAELLEGIRRWPNSCGQEAWDAIKQIHRLATLFRNQQRPVIYTRNVYRADKWDMGSWLWKHAPSRPDHASHQAARRSPDDIVDDIAPQATDFVINKQKPSAFFGTPLQSHLTLLGVDSLVVVGGSTSGCVRATVVDAFSANYRVAVAADGCFDRLQASHATSLVDMDAKYADVLLTAEIVEHFARAQSGD